MASTKHNKKDQRAIRHKRVRAKISGTATTPRLAVYKSNRFISVQLIDDTKGNTLAASHGRAFPGSLSVQSVAVGKEIAKEATTKGITSVVFDRGGYNYAGQVKALAEAAREAGLTF